MIVSLVIDSVYWKPSIAEIPYSLETLSDHSKHQADAILINERNAHYFSSKPSCGVQLAFQNSSLFLLQVTDAQLVIENYTRYFFSSCRSINHWVGVTGTNGKTTTVYYLEQLLSDHYAVATIGTLGVRIKGEKVKEAFSSNTTLPLLELIKAAKLAVASGCEIILLEASSIGFVEGRLNNIPFSCIVAHEVSHDHLDYHGSFNHYLDVKQQIVQLASCCVVTKPAYLQGLKSKNSLVVLPTSDLHKLNEATAVSCCEFLRLSYTKKKLTSPPGRYEVITIGDVRVVIDFAHTPDALQKLVDSFQGSKTLIIGCGGDRDRAKREVIGQIAEIQCNRVIITMDNPRFEDSLQPLLDIKKGAPSALILADRRAAIWYALTTSKQGDIVIIAGKGNEPFIEYREVKIPYTDRSVIEEWVNQ